MTETVPYLEQKKKETIKNSTRSFNIGEDFSSLLLLNIETFAKFPDGSGPEKNDPATVRARATFDSSTILTIQTETRPEYQAGRG